MRHVYHDRVLDIRPLIELIGSLRAALVARADYLALVGEFMDTFRAIL